MKNLEEVEKVSIQEKIKFNLKSIPKKISISKKTNTNTKMEDFYLMSESFDAKDFAYNNGWDRKANKFTRDAKSKYISADKAYFKATGQNMVITSGTRDVYKQADLYIKFKYQGQGNPASWPGCSFHNWGVAADMVRTNETELVKAMKKAGWTRTVLPREPWHFECTSSPDHSKAARSINNFRKPLGLAYKWSAELASYFAKVKDYNKRVPIYNSRLEKYKANQQQLSVEIDNFNRDLSKLKVRISKFNSDVNTYNSELQRAKNLYNEIINMPAGPARDRKIREYNRLVNWLDSESTRLDRESNYIDRENDRMSNWSDSLDRKIAQSKREEAWLTREYNDLTKIEKQLEKHKETAANYLKQIASLTGV